MNISDAQIQGVLFVINSSLIVTSVAAIIKMDWGRLKLWFLVLLAGLGLWLNPLMLLRSSEISKDFRFHCAWLAFFGISILSAAFFQFIQHLTGRADRQNRWERTLVVGAFLIMAAGAAGGFVIRGATFLSGALELSKGPLYLPLMLMVVGSAATALTILFRAMRAAGGDEHVIHLKYIFLSCLLVLGTATIFNFLIPWLMGNSSYSWVSAIAACLFVASVLAIILYGEFLEAFVEFRLLMREAKEENPLNISFITTAIKKIRGRFAGEEGGEPLILEFAFSSVPGLPQTIGKFLVAPEKWRDGLDDTIKRQGEANVRLHLGLEQAHRTLQELGYNHIGKPLNLDAKSQAFPELQSATDEDLVMIRSIIEKGGDEVLILLAQLEKKGLIHQIIDRIKDLPPDHSNPA